MAYLRALLVAFVAVGATGEGFCPAQCLSLAHYCRNTVGGNGSAHLANPGVLNTCENCMDAFTGVSCESCKTDAACANGRTCMKSAALHDDGTGYMDCNLLDETMTNILADGRANTTGSVHIKWEKAGGWSRNVKDGEMALTMYRSEPNGYLSNFFHCEASRCVSTARRLPVGRGIIYSYVNSVIKGEGSLDNSYASTEDNSALLNSDPLSTRGWTIVGLLVVTAVVMCLTGCYPNGPLRRNVVKYLGLVLCIELLALITSSMWDMNTKIQKEIETATAGSQGEADTYVEVTYTCTKTSCDCAQEDPKAKPEWKPKCHATAFEKILHGLNGEFRIVCDNSTAAESALVRDYFQGEGSPCVFAAAAAGPFLIGCNVTQCVKDSAVAEVIVPTGTSPAFLYAAVAVVAGCICAVGLHSYYSMSRTKKYTDEWCKRYLTVGEDGTGAIPESYNLDEHGGGSEAPLDSIRLGTRLLSYFIGSGADAKRILNKITLEIPSGESLAIMGPSGAGKTTFLDLLAAREKSGVVTGGVLVDGEAVTGSLRDMYKDIIGYVSQEDTLIPSLTVLECVMYSARLRLPAGMPDCVKQAKAEHVIADLGLTHCKDSRVGGGGRRGISGGEKRRVSIAMELVANPRILFLDEPTSGLDSYNAFIVMETIAKMKHRSCTTQYQSFFNYKPAIVFSIHQPSKEIFETFDNLMLLSKGSLLFCGQASAAVDTFARLGYRAPDTISNPSDFLLKIASTLSPEERGVLASAAMAQSGRGLVRASDAAKLNGGVGESDVEDYDEEDGLLMMGDGLDAPVPMSLPSDAVCRGVPAPLQQAANNRKYYVNFYQELLIVGKRGYKCLVGNYYMVMCHIMVTLVLGGLLLVFYSRQPHTLDGVLNRAGCLSFTMLLLGFSSMSALELFLIERHVYVAERNNRYYSSLSYFLTKIVFDIVPLRIIPPVFLGSITYNQMGLRTVCSHILPSPQASNHPTQDDPSHFMWFLCVLVLFNIIAAGISFNSGM